jgi:hypothetical protein
MHKLSSQTSRPRARDRPALSDAPTSRPDRTIELAQSLCPLIQSVAADNGLPVEFFARLIWQESRLRPDAIGPVTRSGKRAQGIAQFMPATAADRLLLDAFDPAQALPKSAEFLRELRAQFGNLGRAAAAYNAGPQRVQDWLAGKRRLPSETLAYVRSVTGHSAEEWKRPDARTLTIPAGTPCVRATKLATKPAPATPTVQPQPPSAAWAVQLIGDRLESTALARYNQLQKKYQPILGGREPLIVRTMLGSAAIWHRVRIAAETREAAEALCSPCSRRNLSGSAQLISSRGSRARRSSRMVRARWRTYRRLAHKADVRPKIKSLLTLGACCCDGGVADRSSGIR